MYFSNIFVIILKNKYENSASIKYIAVSGCVITDSENKFSKPNIAVKKDIIIATSRVVLIVFNGYDILYICINPVVANSNTASVDTS